MCERKRERESKRVSKIKRKSERKERERGIKSEQEKEREIYKFVKGDKDKGYRAKIRFLKMDNSGVIYVSIAFHSHITCKNRLKNERAT